MEDVLNDTYPKQKVKFFLKLENKICCHKHQIVLQILSEGF
jgi:hypothetical protein